MRALKTLRLSLGLWGLVALASTRSVDAAEPADVHERFGFAQTYVGFSVAGAPQTGTLTSELTGERALPPMVAPRLIIGALHFWGHLDLYGAFSPVWFRSGRSNDTTRLTIGAETGATFIHGPFVKAPYGRSSALRGRRTRSPEAGGLGYSTDSVEYLGLQDQCALLTRPWLVGAG